VPVGGGVGVEMVVGLIGAGIGGSFSPALHEREAARLGFGYEYRLLDLEALDRPPEDVGALVAEAQADGFRGLNVTHPCKQLVLPALDELSGEAAALGAVNTVVFEADGRRVGHNTDASGFREAFERGLEGARRDHVVLVGAGGAGAAVGHAILSLGAQQLTVVDLDREQVEATVAALGPRAMAGELAALEQADGLIHATPTGMEAHPGSAVPPELLAPRLWVAEVVYMPLETQLLEDARGAGCRTLDGGAMVALQAAGSLELFTGVRPDRDRMLAHVDELCAAQSPLSA
jgi:shikimate dehydrogenase